MATKNKAAVAAPEKPKTLTAGQKAAATKAANAKAATEEAKDKAKKAVPPKAAPKPAVKIPAKTIAKAPKAEPQEPVETVEVETSSMGRKQLASAIRSHLKADGIGASDKIVEQMVAAFEAVVQNALASGTDVALPGFGKFRVALRQGGERRNPQSGEKMQVAASWAVSFKVGKALKDAANTRPVE